MIKSVNTILFDLGNTLVRYYTREEFPDILRSAIEEVARSLRSEGFTVDLDSALEVAPSENYEFKGPMVRPLVGRLTRIFRLDETAIGPERSIELCRCFLKPIFATARVYEDTMPVLSRLRSARYRMAIVSNTPWGSPASLWREEVGRLGLADSVETIVFCDDVGWRKPDRRIFEHVMAKLGVQADECVFVGDDPRWDIAGPREIGMDAILIDRENALEQNSGGARITDLHQLLDLLEAFDGEL